MRKLFLKIVLLFLAAATIMPSCARKAKLIPSKQMSQIYVDLFIADQWLRANNANRKEADTTLFYDAVFQKHGYTFEDFDRSVHYYIDKPDELADISQDALETLKMLSEQKSKLRDKYDEIVAKNKKLDKLYIKKSFGLDSLNLVVIKSFWEKIDSLEKNKGFKILQDVQIDTLKFNNKFKIKELDD